MRRPAGSCDRVLLRPSKPLAFSATVDTFSCLNFTATPLMEPTPGKGFVTIYEGDRVIWSGHEEDAPEEYR